MPIIDRIEAASAPAGEFFAGAEAVHARWSSRAEKVSRGRIPGKAGRPRRMKKEAA